MGLPIHTCPCAFPCSTRFRASRCLHLYTRAIPPAFLSRRNEYRLFSHDSTGSEKEIIQDTLTFQRKKPFHLNT